MPLLQCLHKLDHEQKEARIFAQVQISTPNSIWFVGKIHAELQMA